MRTPTNAQAALARRLDSSDPLFWGSQSALARALGVRQPSVNAWAQGDARPDAYLRDAIERLFGIPAAEWQTEEERAVIEAQTLGAPPPPPVPMPRAPLPVPPSSTPGDVGATSDTLPAAEPAKSA